MPSVKRNGDIQAWQSYQLIFFMIQTNLCERFHCSLWVTKWTLTRNHSLIHRPRTLYKPTHFWILQDWSWQSNVLYGYNWTSSGHSKLFSFWTKSKMASVAKGKLGYRLNDDVILRNSPVRRYRAIINFESLLGNRWYSKWISAQYIHEGTGNNIFAAAQGTDNRTCSRIEVRSFFLERSVIALKGNKTGAERN